MKRNLLLMTALALCALAFTGCADSETASPDAPEAEAGACCVTFEDGDSFDCPVEAYGEEFTLPESTNEEVAGEFYGWLGTDGLYQPGDTVVAEEFMSFTALRADPGAGTLLALDTVRGGYSVTTSEEEPMTLYSPYDNCEELDYEDFFDCWTDEAGNTYEGGESVTVEKGEMLVLNAVYSTDYSAAYKVEVHYNTGNPDFDMAYTRYVKKGCSIPLSVSMEPAGCRFDGWYDAPDGGERIGSEMDYFTPDSDISLYGRWIEE